MSLSQPKLTNPAFHYYEWRSGKLSYWDKENQKSVEVKLPFQFIVLDELATISGFCEPDNSGFWSNEVRSTVKEQFTVRTKKGVKYIGPYKNDQYIVQVPNGAKFTKSIYIAEKLNGGYVISNIKLSGAAFSSWFEYSGKYKADNGLTTLTGSHEDKKGATTFQVPDFEYSSLTPDQFTQAVELDKDLQVYLSHYLAAAQTELDEQVSHDAIDPNLGKASPEQLADFERRKAGSSQLQAEDFPEDDQERYNRQAVEDVWPSDDSEPLPEFRG